MVIRVMSGVGGSEFKGTGKSGEVDRTSSIIPRLFPTSLPADMGQSFHHLEPRRVYWYQETYCISGKPVDPRYLHRGSVRIWARESQHGARLQIA